MIDINSQNRNKLIIYGVIILLSIMVLVGVKQR